jgi:chromate reductase
MIFGIPSALSSRAVSQALLRYGAKSLVKQTDKFTKPNSKITLDIASIGTLPLFDGDKYKHEVSFPSDVRIFREKLEKSQAVIFSCNENELGHYYSISGPLQNAIDWGVHSRNLFKQKTCGFISHGRDYFEGENCFHLRLECIAIGGRCLTGPRYNHRGHIMDRVDLLSNGDLVSEDVKNYVDTVLSDVVSFSQGTGRVPRTQPEFHLTTRSDPTGVKAYYSPTGNIIEDEDALEQDYTYGYIATDYTDA